MRVKQFLTNAKWDCTIWKQCKTINVYLLLFTYYVCVRFASRGKFFKVIKRCIKWKSMQSYHPSDFRRLLLRFLAPFLFEFHALCWAKPCSESDCVVCVSVHSLQSVHVCCSFLLLFAFHSRMRKRDCISFRMHIFFLSSSFNAISFWNTLLFQSLLLSFTCLFVCINNRISIKISNLFSSKSEKNFVRHFDFCMTQKIKIYNQIPYIRWLFLSHPTLLFSSLPFLSASHSYLMLAFPFLHALAHSVDKWRHIHSSRAHWEYDRKMAKIPRFRITFSVE